MEKLKSTSLFGSIFLSILLAIYCGTLYSSKERLLVSNEFRADMIYSRDKEIAELHRRLAECKAVGSVGSATLGAAHGGVWNSLVRGKDAVAIVSGLLVVDSADTPAERMEATADVLESIAAKTDSKLVALVAAHFRSPNASTLQAMVDFALEKK